MQIFEMTDYYINTLHFTCSSWTCYCKLCVQRNMAEQVGVQTKDPPPPRPYNDAVCYGNRVTLTSATKISFVHFYDSEFNS